MYTHTSQPLLLPPQDEGLGGSMDESLQQALRTASKLKQMSGRMRDSLHDEINRSIRESSFLFAS